VPRADWTEREKLQTIVSFYKLLASCQPSRSKSLRKLSQRKTNGAVVFFCPVTERY
jgi:hypothetical protein